MKLVLLLSAVAAVIILSRYRLEPVYATHVVTSKTGAPYVKLNGQPCTHEVWQRQFLAGIDEGDELCVASGSPYLDRNKVLRWQWTRLPEESSKETEAAKRAEQQRATCDRLRDTPTSNLSLNDWAQLRACQ
jgi:hypothetical protein